MSARGPAISSGTYMPAVPGTTTVNNRFFSNKSTVYMLQRLADPQPTFFSRSRYCLRNFATFGAMTLRQYPWSGFLRKYSWW